METRNGNEITTIRYVLHAWEKQQTTKEGRLLNIKGDRIWVSDTVGGLYDKFKIVDPEFANEFAIRCKEAWWYLIGFKRKRDPGIATKYLDFGIIKGKDLGAKFELVLERMDTKKFGLICFDLFPISKRIKLFG
jgi:hypothetical protein